MRGLVSIRQKYYRWAGRFKLVIAVLLGMSLIALVLPNWLFVSAAAQSQPGEEWAWSNPLPQGHNLNSIVWSGDKFVAVGDYGTILTSHNGVSWTVCESGTREELLGATWGSDKYVAVGSYGRCI